MTSSTAQRGQRIDLRLSAELKSLTGRDWRAFLTGLDRAHRRRPKLEAAAKRYLRRRAAR